MDVRPGINKITPALYFWRYYVHAYGTSVNTKSWRSGHVESILRSRALAHEPFVLLRSSLIVLLRGPGFPQMLVKPFDDDREVLVHSSPAVTGSFRHFTDPSGRPVALIDTGKPIAELLYERLFL